MITDKQMACGFYPREMFREQMEDDARVGRTDLDAAHPCDPTGLPATDHTDPREVEDALIEHLDRKRAEEKKSQEVHAIERRFYRNSRPRRRHHAHV